MPTTRISKERMSELIDIFFSGKDYSEFDLTDEELDLLLCMEYNAI